MAWRESSFEDYATKFPARVVPNAAPVSSLRPAPDELPAAFATVTYPSTTGPNTAPTDAFLASTGSRALLVLRDDTLLVERYWGPRMRPSRPRSLRRSPSTPPWSASPSPKAAIGSVDDPIVRYLPELSGRGLDRVTIRHLLGMDSGLRHDGAGSGGMLWQDDARTYYNPDLRALALTVRPAVEPGTRWEYNNYHPLRVGLILERATGRHVADYLSEKLWQPLGMEAPGSWSLDSRPGDLVHACKRGRYQGPRARSHSQT